MRIVILIKGFPPSTVAGTEVATEQLTKHLAMIGVDAHVITVRKTGEDIEESRDGYTIHRVKEEKGIFGRYSYYGRLKELIRKIDPDIIHAQGLYSEALFGVRIARRLDKKVVLFPRGSDILEASGLDRYALGWALRNSDLVLAQTRYMKRAVEEEAHRPITVKIVPNGIDLERFTAHDKDKAREKLVLPIGPMLLLFVGRLVAKKCPGDVIEAFNIVCIKKEGVSLVMLGEGDKRKELERDIRKFGLQDRVKLMGRVENAIIPDYMTASNALVLPSYAEGFPMTFIEAMAAGLPILTSDDGANPEIVIDGTNGFISPLHDPGRLADHMIKLIDFPDVRNRMGKENRKKAEGYTWEKIATRLRDIYISLLSDASG